MGKKIRLLMLGALLLSGCTLPSWKKDQGALQVTSNLGAEVYLDDNHVGQTPYFNDKLKTGEYTLKLTPGGGEDSSWQSKVTVGKSVLTVVSYEFGSEPDQSSYQILQLETLGDKNASELVISTLPDNVVVKLDGELKGFSPVSFTTISAGDHTIGLEAPGYQTKTINAKVNQGHRLNVMAQLAKDVLTGNQASDSGEMTTPTANENETVPTPSPTANAKASPTPTPKVTPTPKASPTPTPSPSTTPGVINGASDASSLTPPYVKILETGTGWLRVRSEPNANGDNEVAKVKVGTYFKFVEKDDAGWTKLEYQTGEEGFVASKYTQLTE